ncbi:MAG: DNA polymerase, partial [Dehalococcoidia bacterium]
MSDKPTIKHQLSDQWHILATGARRNRAGAVLADVMVGNGSVAFYETARFNDEEERAAWCTKAAAQVAGNDAAPDERALAAALLHILPALVELLKDEVKETQADRLVDLIDDLDDGDDALGLWHDTDDEPWATVIVEDPQPHREHLKIGSRRFRRWLARYSFLKTEKTPGGQALSDAENTMAGKALFAAPRYTIATRVAWGDDHVTLDVGDEQWTTIRVGPGGWQIEAEPSARFRRSGRTLPILTAPPVAGADIAELFDFVHVDPDDRPFVLTWLVGTLLRGPYTLLALIGNQGTGKSTSGRVLRRLVDPVKADLGRLPDSERDLAIRCANNLIVALDNLSSIPEWCSDALSTVLTGGGFSTRRLHSDDDEVVFEHMRPVLLTAITEVVTRPDLADRTVRCEMPPLRRKVKEAAFWQEFEAARPRLVGALLDALSVALRRLSETQIPDDQNPRMADYAALGAALTPIWQPLVEGDAGFLERYAAKRRDAETAVADTSLLAEVLARFVNNVNEWTGTARELLTLLPVHHSDDEKEQARLTRAKEWPKQPAALSAQLRRLAPVLPRVGVGIDFLSRGHGGTRRIALWWCGDGPRGPGDGDPDEGPSPDPGVGAAQQAQRPERPSPASPASPDADFESENAPKPGDGDGDGPPDPRSEGPSPAPEIVDGDGGDVGDGDSVSCAQSLLPYTLVTTGEQLAGVVTELAANPSLLGVDTETTGLDPLTDRLRLIQIALADHVFLIDCFAVDPRPLRAVFTAERQIAGHNLAFDLRFLESAGVSVQARCFDTELAARLLEATGTHERRAKGHFGLAAVAGRYLDEKVSKAEQLSDWSGGLTPAQITYAVRDAAILLPLAAVLASRLSDDDLSRTAAIEFGAIPAVAGMEQAGTPFDVDAWRTLSDAALADRLRLEQEMQALLAAEMPDDPEVVPQPVIYGKRGQPLKQSKRTPVWASPADRLPKLLRRRGHTVTTTKSETLTPLADADPFVRLLLDYREADKRATTYGIDWAAKHVHTDGRIHASFHQIGSEAGRMSCSAPNLQQIPGTPAYRACIKPGAGRVLVKADYSQIELRIAAQIAGDAVLRAAYQQGQDVHVQTAAAVLGIVPAQVTKEQRQLAKALNFGLLYGMGAATLQEHAATNYRVTLSRDEAERFRGAFFRTYPGLRRWHRQQGDDATTTRTLAGRLRRGVSMFTEKLNSPVQGTGADILKQALAWLWEDRAAYPRAQVINVVHDEILVECDADDAT